MLQLFDLGNFSLAETANAVKNSNSTGKRDSFKLAMSLI